MSKSGLTSSTIPKPKKSISAKLFKVYSTLILVLALIYSGLIWLFSFYTEDLVLEGILNNESKYVEATYRATGSIPPPRVDYISAYQTIEDMPEYMQEAIKYGLEESELFTEQGHFHVQQLDLGNGLRPYLVAEVTQLMVVTKTSKDTGILLSIIALLIMIISLFVPYRLSNRIAKPLKQLAAEVQNQFHAKGSPLNKRHSQDEIAFLADSLNAVFEKWQTALMREQNFTRDVSHELRTPITQIKNMLQLKQDGQFSETEMRQLLDASNDLEQTVDVLLALARESNMQAQQINLRASIEAAVLQLYHLDPDAVSAIQIDVSDNIIVGGNKHLVHLLNRNLIFNCYYHGEIGGLKIVWENDTLYFTNPISTSTQQSSSNVRHAGFGHGLFLVERICESLNWGMCNSVGDEFKISISPQDLTSLKG